MIKISKVMDFNKEYNFRGEAVCRVHVSLLRGETFGFKAAKGFELCRKECKR
jgi:hypothetical protein